MGDTHIFHKAQLAVIRLSAWQFLLTLALALLAVLFVDNDFALSVVSGGFIGMFAGFYQAQRMLRVDAGKHPDAFMRGLWISELVKIALTVALFVVAIRLLRVQMVPTIIGYAGTYIIYWVALGTRYPWFESPVTNNLRDKNWPDD
jgi:ATP synthase protein I